MRAGPRHVMCRHVWLCAAAEVAVRCLTFDTIVAVVNATKICVRYPTLRQKKRTRDHKIYESVEESTSINGFRAPAACVCV